MNRRRISFRSAILAGIPFAVVLAALAPRARAADSSTPPVTHYEATVPDTLDLAERGRLAVHGLTSFLDPDANYAPYGHTFLNGNPPYFGNLPAGPPNWGKIAESLLFARAMSGSEENAEIDAKMIDGMLKSDWMRLNPVAPTPVSRVMLALMALYQINPTRELKVKIDELARQHVAAAKLDGDDAYYNDDPPDEGEKRIGTLGNWFPVFVQGCAIRPLARWGAMTGQKPDVEFAGKLSRYIMRPKFWTPEGEAKVVAAAEHGEFRGHHHGYTQGLMGLIWYAEATNDARVKEFVREAYEYSRTFGLARIGLFGEGCTTGDMTYLALKLSDLGVGDYWDDADQYVRNELAELQLTDADALRKATEHMPKGRGRWDEAKGPLDPKNESADHLVERTLGVFLSDSTHPTLIPEHSFMYTICCTGNCTPAIYAAWESIVRCKEGAAQINLLLNRASPWLDLDSHLPYEGKVEIRNETAKSISVRIPRWVDKRAVESSIGGAKASPFWVGQYLVFASLRGGEKIVITFPMVETTEKYTLKWKQSEFWKESTDPGKSWRADEPPVQYTLRLRGNTLMDIEPRDTGVGYPMYRREGLKGERAPMIKVERCLSAVTPAW